MTDILTLHLDLEDMARPVDWEIPAAKIDAFIARFERVAGLAPDARASWHVHRHFRASLVDGLARLEGLDDPDLRSEALGGMGVGLVWLLFAHPTTAEELRDNIAMLLRRYGAARISISSAPGPLAWSVATAVDLSAMPAAGVA
jgi:hypothetical protein